MNSLVYKHSHIQSSVWTLLLLLELNLGTVHFVLFPYGLEEPRLQIAAITVCTCVRVYQGVVRAVTGSVSWALPFGFVTDFIEVGGEGERRMVGKRERKKEEE